MEIEFEDHSAEIRAAFEQAKARALEKIGLAAEGYAKRLCPVDTGGLRNSISYAVSGDAAYIGSNKNYAAYVEMGTGKYYPGGRQTPWAYEDANGNWHRTSGSPPRPFLKPAAADHPHTYRGIIEDEFKKG